MTSPATPERNEQLERAARDAGRAAAGGHAEVLLEQRARQPQVRQPERAGVAGRAGSDDDDLKVDMPHLP
jgi:hypothetical protein